MDRKIKEELNELSKSVFGSSSRWRKLVENGVPQPVERQREVMVPNRMGGLEMKTFTDRKNVVKRYTIDEVRELMKALKGPTLVGTTSEKSITVDVNGNNFESGTVIISDGLPEGTTVK